MDGQTVYRLTGDAFASWQMLAEPAWFILAARADRLNRIWDQQRKSGDLFVETKKTPAAKFFLDSGRQVWYHKLLLCAVGITRPSPPSTMSIADLHKKRKRKF